MKLVMFVGDRFVAAVPVNRAQITWPGYLSSLKRKLLQQHAERLLLAKEPPAFLLQLNTPPPILPVQAN